MSPPIETSGIALPAQPRDSMQPIQPADPGLSRYWLSAISLFAMLALSVPVTPSADTWWHLSTGQYILQHKSIPRVDVFSSTAAGKPWIAHEWLSDLIFFAIHAVAGSAGLLFFTAIVIALAFWFAYQRSDGPALARVFALGLGLWTISPIVSVRPQIFTYLLASAFLSILSRYTAGAPGKSLLALPLLAVCWVNLHGGYMLGPALVLLFALGVVADGLARLHDSGTTKRYLRGLLLIFLLCLAVVPLNPHGFTMYAYPFATLHSTAMQAGIMEWLSPDFHEPMFYPLAALLFLTVGILALSPSRPKPSQVLLFIFFALATLRSMRNLPFFVLVAFPLLGEYSFLPSWKWPALNPGLQRTLQRAAVVLAAALATQVATNRMAGELQMEKAHFPLRAAAFLDAQRLPAPIFNSYNFGGYLIWKLYPRYRVYIDGRADLYGDAFLNDFVQVYDASTDPRPTLDRAGIRTVILEPRSNLASFLRNQKDWNRVYEDPVAVIFSR